MSSLPKLLYFCDETSQTDEYMAVGGLAVALEAVPLIQADIENINRGFGISWSEVKWTNCKRNGGKIHKAYIDYLFGLIEAGRAHFHIRFSHMPDYDHSLSGWRRKTDTVSKAYWQLIVHRSCRYYGNSCDLYLRLDNGACTSLLPNMVDNMNYHANHRYNYCQRDPIKHIECRDSSKEPILQLLDVPLGALAAYRNKRHEHAQAHPIKTQLAEYTFSKQC